jgi:GT2 family glycosyltransferase
MAASGSVVSVVLNSNRRDDTCECLASLRANRYPDHRIVVLDNASTDGSVEVIRARFPGTEIIRLEENRGYAGNNNVGIRAALASGAEWVFVLNEDVVLAPDCLAELMVVAASDPRIGILGPMVYHHDEPEVIQSAGGRLGPYWISSHFGQDQPDRGQFGGPHPVEWISGCAILVRRAVVEQVGMFDERFFIYWEETDWCVRVGRAGWRIVHVPAARIWHKGVQRDYRPRPSVTYYSTRNRLLMLSKHSAPLPARLAAWGQILRTLASWSIRPKWRHQREHRNAMWRGVRDYLSGRWGGMPT